MRENLFLFKFLAVNQIEEIKHVRQLVEVKDHLEAHIGQALR